MRRVWELGRRAVQRFEVLAVSRQAAEIMGAGCVSPETGARNECAGGAMKNAKEKARGLLRRPGFRSRRSGHAFRYSDDVEPSQASHPNGCKVINDN
jgi:hypothetical protein